MFPKVLNIFAHYIEELWSGIINSERCDAIQRMERRHQDNVWSNNSDAKGIAPTFDRRASYPG